MVNGFDRPLEELEAAREAEDDLMKPSRRVVADACKRADYCVYSMGLGYTFVDNPDMRHLGVLLLEIRRLEAGLKVIGENSLSYRPVVDRILAGSPASGRAEHE